MNSIRSFHSSVIRNGFRKKSGPQISNSLFKRGTPKKTAGSIKNFKKTASFSKYGLKAPELSHIPQLSLESIDQSTGTGVETEAETGNILYRYPDDAARKLYQVGGAPKFDHHELFHDPITVLRDPYSSLINDVINGKATLSGPSPTSRICLFGDAGVGKSTVISQALLFAFMKGDHIVINIPTARILLGGFIDSVYHSNLGVFAQPMYTRQWLRKILQSNKPKLETLGIYDTIANSVKGSDSVAKTNNASGDSAQSLQLLFDTLSTQNQFPVLFTVDNINVFSDKVYSDNWDSKTLKPIYHGDLHVPRLVYDYLSGKKGFSVAGSTVLVSTSSEHSINATMMHALGLGTAVPYVNNLQYDPEIVKNFEGVTPIKVGRMSLKEVEALLSALDSAVTNAKEKYFESGNGNPRYILKSLFQFM